MSDLTDDRKARFLREARLATRISHPNVVSVLDFGEIDDSPYLVMQHMPGGTVMLIGGEPTMNWDACKVFLEGVPLEAGKELYTNGILLTDDQTLASLSVMDGVRGALADEGTTFERAFVSNALCCPSRATLFSGQYSHNHGVLTNGPPLGGWDRLQGTSNWLPTWLRRTGYRTAHVGKFLNGYGRDDFELREDPPPPGGASGPLRWRRPASGGRRPGAAAIRRG